MLLTNFWLAPILAFYAVHQEVHETLFFAADLAHDADQSRIEETRASLRRLAARLSALTVWPNRFPHWWFRFKRLQPAAASQGLIGFSNSLRNTDGRKVVHRDTIERSLGLPRTSTDRAIEAVRARLAEGRTSHAAPVSPLDTGTRP
jgi:hypothetical protein